MEQQPRGATRKSPWWSHALTIVVVAASLTVAWTARGTDDDTPASGLVFNEIPEQEPPGLPSNAAPTGEAPRAASPLATAPITTTPVATSPDISTSPAVESSIAVIGDSLVRSAQREIATALDGSEVFFDAADGRTIAEGAAPLQAVTADRPGVIVIALGTNDLNAEPERVAGAIEAILAATSGVPCVVWVDVQPFEPALADLNRRLYLAVDATPNAHVATWSNLAGPAELHLEDGFHLSEEGRVAYANLIATAVSLFC